MNISITLLALALEFAHACYSDVELEDYDTGYKWHPAQLQTRFDTTMFDPEMQANLKDYTVIQLGMLADQQRESDSEYWVMQDAHDENNRRDRDALIERTIAMGAGDRETAERWLNSAYDD